ncbi:oxidoreductase [Aquibacillus halophilus]|uniref:Oxidoreductase n=1 Tax=Aquibacillus halophilus TaxID=930132 RepID=A0A6A8DJB1_9BACI|nr:Gfo/Idh/MocA family oxidoreductase [Aquibacillus halophilus]MRH44566.1 oxidoreductase [Aquibacillus halophilus]
MVRFGIIGTNWITEKFINAASEVDDFSLTAIYSRTQERATEFADKFNVDRTYTSLAEFVQSDDVDAVYIASPTSFHAEHAIACMKGGKHVIVEKALASNSEEVKLMIETAKQNNVLLMEALKTTHVPNYKAIKDNLHKIGTVRRYFASYCQYSSRYDSYKEGTVLNAFKPEFSNGSLMDIGIYCIYPMINLFGKPTKLSANGLMLKSGVDGQGSVIFDYENLNGVVMFSKISNSYVQSEIQGEKGSILLDSISEPTHVEIKYKDGSTEDLTQNQKSNTMYYEAKAFIELIMNNQTESLINTFENSLNIAIVLEQARKQMGVVFPADQSKV